MVLNDSRCATLYLVVFEPGSFYLGVFRLGVLQVGVDHVGYNAD